jgi:hypothetical protein
MAPFQPEEDPPKLDIRGIREALHNTPFEPFLIRLAHGQSLPVPHRDSVELSTRRIVVLSEDDLWSIIEPLLIVSLDSMPKKKRGMNGKKKPKS